MVNNSVRTIDLEILPVSGTPSRKHLSEKENKILFCISFGETFALISSHLIVPETIIVFFQKHENWLSGKLGNQLQNIQQRKHLYQLRKSTWFLFFLNLLIHKYTKP